MRNIDELIEGLKLKDWRKREKNFKEIMKIAERKPFMLYPKWDIFVESLFSDNVYWQYQAIYIVSNLTKIDKKNKFEKIFDKYFDLLNHESVVVASHVALNAAKIVENKPKLEPKITKRLLEMEKSRHKHNKIVQAYAMEALSKYFKDAKDKRNILKFAEKQLKTGNPKGKIAAKEVIKNAKEKNKRS